MSPRKLRGDLPELGRWAAQHDHFQAQIVRQVGVQRGDDQFVVVVLQLHQVVAELRAVMVVDQRQRAGGVLRLARPSLLGKRVAEQLANGLAAGGELLLAAVAIELLQQVVFQRNRKADDFGHGSGQWAVDSGQWAVGSGQWTVGSGQWTVGSGQWAVDSGQWTVDSGQWAVDSGQWAENGNCPLSTVH